VSRAAAAHAAMAVREAIGETLAGRLAVSADDVARVIERAVTARRPRARSPVGV
jgi:hypothetical protein